jgi:hypothetical protein
VCFDDREELLSPGDAVDVAPGRRISFATTRANRSAVLKPGYAMNRKGLAQRYAAGAS